jgi:uncharacterized delta-60 repeat protein
MNFSHAPFKRAFVFAQLFAIVLISIAALQAQTGSRVDTTFDPFVAKDRDSFGERISANFALQPDGKIIVFGAFQVINGTLKNRVARLNENGSLDNSFDCATCDFNVGSVIVQPDGKVVVAGAFSSFVSGTTASVVRRLNADGSLDASFNTPFNAASDSSLNTSATVWAVQADGKVIVSVFSSQPNFNGSSIFRLNADGTIDNSFTKIDFSYSRTLFDNLVKVVVLPDGKILAATNVYSLSSSGRLRRFNSDGTLDATFEQPMFADTTSFGSYRLNDFEVLNDGSIIAVGVFKLVNGVSRVNIVKLQSAGNVDLSFAPPNVFQIGEPANAVEIYSDGKILVSTVANSNPGFPTGTTNRFIRYNTDGSVDDTFNIPSNLQVINRFRIDGTDKILLYAGFIENGAPVYKFTRLNTDGSLESAFVVNYATGGTVTKLAVQANGKIIIAGDFSYVNGVARPNLARLNSDGTLDSTFNPGAGFNNTIEKILIQPDGKILVGGTFSIYNGTAVSSLVRLNPDGSLEITFNPDIVGTVNSIDLQTADGKILIGGNFSSINGQTRNGAARLNSDGGLDASFNPIISAGAAISRILVQPDGKIVIGGSFSAVNGFARSNLVRLNSDGSLDTNFNAGNISIVDLVERQADGKYVVVKQNGFTQSAVVRLNANGTIDAAFQAANTNDFAKILLIQPDGSILVGGNFTNIGGFARRKLARLKSNGTVDTLFFPSGADNTVLAFARQADGKILIGGSFTRIDNFIRLGIARLIVAPVRASFNTFDYDGDGRADYTVFRPSNGVWYELGSQSNAFQAVQFGISGDRTAPADYDGDGKTDFAVFRENASGGSGYFYIIYSSDNSFRPILFGQTGDFPVSGDWDGDGIGDVAVYRDGSLTGGSSLFIYRPSSAPGVDFRVISWGAAGDKPIAGDFDGDGKLDAAVFRASMGQWFVLQSSDNQLLSAQFGSPTDIPVAADYDGDGKTNFAVFRPSTGYWYTSNDPATNYGGIQFGGAGDLPIPADYDGDGKADVAVFRPSNGVWYIQRSTQGFIGVQFGANGDQPAPNAYIR